MRFRLTLAGWVFAGATVLVAVVAINSGLAMLFVMFGCMVGALHVSAVLSRRMISAVQVRRELAERCWQNHPLAVGYELRSVRGGGACLALRVRELGGGGMAFPTAHCGHLPGRGSRRGLGRVEPARRGRFGLEWLDLSTTFPFGLIRASRQVRQAASLVVWPARGRLTGTPMGRGEAEASAAAPSVRAGGQDEFYGLREYRPGDNPRWIHWRRSAGRPKPVLREMSKPQPTALWVVLDAHLDGEDPVSAAAARLRRERGIRFAATLIDQALSDGYRVGLALAGAETARLLPPGRRRGQRERLLDALAEVPERPAPRLKDVLARLRPSRVDEAHVVVVAPGGAGDGEGLVRLRRQCRSVTVVDEAAMGKLFRDDPAAARAEG